MQIIIKNMYNLTKFAEMNRRSRGLIRFLCIIP